MKTLSISEEQAIELHNDPTGIKAILEDTFGPTLFKARKPWQEITTWEDVFEATGEDPLDPYYLEGKPDDIARKYLKLLPDALNPVGWKEDYNNYSQDKWNPLFALDNPGFRFVGSRYSNTHAHSDVGSRPFASQEISDHAAKCFNEKFKEFFEAL